MKKPSPQRQVEIIMAMSELVAELGWIIALPTEVDTVPGLIIGTEEFAKDVVSAYYGDKAEFFSQNNEGDLGELPEAPEEEILASTKKKGVTWH